MNLRPGRISFQDLGSRKDKDFLVEYAPMYPGPKVRGDRGQRAEKVLNILVSEWLTVSRADYSPAALSLVG